jgi:DNA repair protein RadC
MAALPSPFDCPQIRLVTSRLVRRKAQPAGPTVRCQVDAATLLHQLIGQADREHFVALYLNARHVATHAYIVSVGTVTSTPVHPREVFKGAVLANASAIVVGHNHPSGDVTPSMDDRAMTERLRRAGEVLGIELLDALIVGPVRRFYAGSTETVHDLPV